GAAGTAPGKDEGHYHVSPCPPEEWTLLARP
ncbi:MAG: hypothetical protein QOF55_1521, partial [Thermoleophilaceae bacterium]|nr:hypothetical protein [Thermoleophilaceae bacterium]